MQNPYEEAYRESISPLTREAYWQKYAECVSWFKKPSIILDKSKPPFYRWFPDGELNMCQNCIDRWLPKYAKKDSLIYEAPVLLKYKIQKTGDVFTLEQLHRNVSKLAGALQNLGVKTGDRVIIFMPMIPEAVFSMLACARIGAIHSVVFGGFARVELAARIHDANPSLIITASCGYEPQKKINYQSTIEEALQISPMPNVKILYVDRKEKDFPWKKVQDRDFDFHEMLEKGPMTECVPVPGSHPLQILYTSGTTGKPKGIIRETAGAAIGLYWQMVHNFGMKDGETYFCSADIGWVVGHSFTVQGPLLIGCSTILFEGKPTIPDPGIFWKLIEKQKVSGFYTAPTALRAIRKEDPDEKYTKLYNISTLKTIGLAGERCDSQTMEWLLRNFSHTFINDTYWQTESGLFICSNFKNLHSFKIKIGSCTKPSPGFQVSVVDDENKFLPLKEIGNIWVKFPLPPSFMPTLYNNQQGFLERYVVKVGDGDSGYVDDEGQVFIMGRVDDCIKTSAHLLSSVEMEEIILKNSSILETAVVAKHDELRGDVPVAFAVKKIGVTKSNFDITNELVSQMRNDIGPLTNFKECVFVEKLPKTRSGKILRTLIRDILNDKHITVPPTIEDADAINCIIHAIKKQEKYNSSPAKMVKNENK